jgi:catechol 2,3-dioxygenase-like lactoylglutathione lyase family enzyme
MRYNYRQETDMLSKCEPIGFIPSIDLDRARRFYQDVLGLHLLTDQSPLALVFELKGALLRVVRLDMYPAARHTIFGWKVVNIRNAVAVLVYNGIEMIHYPGMQQDPNGIWAAPDGAQVAWFKDPDGNILSISEFE